MDQHTTAYLVPVVSNTSTVAVHLRELQDDLLEQHAQEKNALNELNHRFCYFFDHVHELETENANRTSQIDDFRKYSIDLSRVDSEWSKRYLQLQSDFIRASHTSNHFGLEVEMHQLQIEIYRRLIDYEQEWKDERRSKLEKEFNESTLTLSELRESNYKVEREVENLHIDFDDAYEKYLKLTQDLYRIKHQRKERETIGQALKNRVALYKKIRSYVTGSMKIFFLALLTKKFFFLY